MYSFVAAAICFVDLSAEARMKTIEVRDESDDAAREYMEKVLAKEIQKHPQLRDTVRLVVTEITGGRPADVHSALVDVRAGTAYDGTSLVMRGCRHDPLTLVLLFLVLRSHAQDSAYDRSAQAGGRHQGGLGARPIDYRRRSTPFTRA